MWCPFNILAVMAVPGLINPLTMDSSVFTRDFMAMGLITLLLSAAIIVDYLLRNRGEENHGHAKLGRRIGSLLLIGYISYYYILFN